MSRGGGAQPDRWLTFIAFWLLAGLTLLTVGIAMFAVVRHAHRVGAFIAFLGIICLAIGLLVRRGGRREER
jgi:uncharacterized membrane protein